MISIDYFFSVVVRTLRPKWTRTQERLHRFQKLMRAVDEIVEINKFALSSLTRSVARSLQTRRLTKALQAHQHAALVSADFDKLFFPTYRPITPDGQSLDDMIYQQTDVPDKKYFRLRLAKDVVLPWAWHRSRLVTALATIGESKKKGKWRSDHNHRVQLLLPFGLGLVHGGNHSLVAGIVDGEGEVIAESLDIGVAYKHIAYDGFAFRRIHDGKVLNAPIEEEPGILFEIGRRMLDLGVQYDADATAELEQTEALE